MIFATSLVGGVLGLGGHTFIMPSFEIRRNIALRIQYIMLTFACRILTFAECMPFFVCSELHTYWILILIFGPRGYFEVSHVPFSLNSCEEDKIDNFIYLQLLRHNKDIFDVHYASS